MPSYRAIVKADLARLRASKRQMRDIFEIGFSHTNTFAYERLNNLHLEQVSYSELRKEIEYFASYLRSNFEPLEGEYIAIDLANGPSYLIAFWGSLMAGYSPYLVNSYYPTKLKHDLLARLNITKVITLSGEYESYIRPSITDYPKNEGELKLEESYWADAFAISSTLTGLEAKIIVYSGSSIAAEIENSDKIIANNPWFMEDYHGVIKVAAILPFFHIFGIMVSYLWFAFFGRTIVFFNDLSSETVRSTIMRHGVTHIFAPPLLFNKLYDGINKGVDALNQRKTFDKGVRLVSKIGNRFPKLGLKLSCHLFKRVQLEAFGFSPRFMISGGAYLAPEVLKTINAIGYPLFNGYGTTEASITGANLNLKFAKRVDGSIGDPFSSVTYTLKEDGTLYVKGESLAKKIVYLNGRVEEINEFATHDIVEYKDGAYFIKGRLNDLFIAANGENVSPDLIEQELKVNYASALCILDLEGQLSLVLRYPDGLSHLLIQKEVADIKEQLSKIAYGSSVTKIILTNDAIANANAIKPSRAQLRRNIKEGHVKFFDLQVEEKKEVSLENEDEETLSIIKALFLESLSKEVDIDNESDFFLDLGGDSLSYISLLSSLQKAFAIHFDLEKDGALRTPRAFYNKIKEQR